MYLTSHSTANSGSDYDSSHCCDEQTEDKGTESKWIPHLLDLRRELESGLRGISVLFKFIRWLRMRTAPRCDLKTILGFCMLFLGHRFAIRLHAASYCSCTIRIAKINQWFKIRGLRETKSTCDRLAFIACPGLASPEHLYS